MRPLIFVVLLAACGGKGGGAVASVQLQTTNTNPKVGDTVHVGATPVDAHGVAVQGVACNFASSQPGIAAVNSQTGAVTAIAAGVTTITADCGGVQASVTITVQPNQVKLTVTIAGTGNGGVFANPTGDGILGLGSAYDVGTNVTLTETASPHSVFMGWAGGGCAGTGNCNVTMNADTAVTATFTLAETFATASNWSAPMNDVHDNIGCNYHVSASGPLTLDIVESNGAVSGTGTATVHVNIVSYSPPANTTCTGNPFDTTPTGNVTGNDAALAAALVNPSGSGHLTFNGSRNGNTITGSATFSYNLKDASGNSYPSQGNTGNFNLAKQ